MLWQRSKIPRSQHHGRVLRTCLVHHRRLIFWSMADWRQVSARITGRMEKAADFFHPVFDAEKNLVAVVSDAQEHHQVVATIG